MLDVHVRAELAGNDAAVFLDGDVAGDVQQVADEDGRLVLELRRLDFRQGQVQLLDALLGFSRFTWRA